MMEEERPALKERKNEITPGGYRFVVFWAAGLLFLYALGGFFGAKRLRSYAAETARIRQAKIESLITDTSAPLPGAGISSAASPVKVHVGLNMNRIAEFALKQSYWTADFILSFRWTGDAVNPGEDFRIVNGQIMQREKMKSYERGGERHEEYHVVAQITKPFDASRFPFGDEGLLVQIEDAIHGQGVLRYVAEEHNINVSSESIPRNVKLARTVAGVQVRHPVTGQSETGVPQSDREAHSRFFFAILIVPESLGIYLKMFQALFASVAVAVIALYIKASSIDCRFGLPVGGFFACVSNNIYVATLLPYADRLTLTDMINAVSLLTIFIVLVQSVISLYIFDNKGQARLSLFFDWVSFAVILTGYFAVNLALPLSARPL
jgi:hypothetical protein